MKYYKEMVFEDGEKLSQLIPSLNVNVNNRHDLMKTFDRYNINSSSKSTIKFTIKRLELCLGIGCSPIPEAKSMVKRIEPLKTYLTLRSKLRLNELFDLTMSNFENNIGRDSHTNSFGDFTITIKLSELYEAIPALYKTDYNLEDESNSLFEAFFHNDDNIYNRLCNTYSPNDVNKMFNFMVDTMKDDEDNISLFTDFLKYRDKKCNGR